jgi:hypothetical protein
MKEGWVYLMPSVRMMMMMMMMMMIGPSIHHSYYRFQIYPLQIPALCWFPRDKRDDGPTQLLGPAFICLLKLKEFMLFLS